MKKYTNKGTILSHLELRIISSVEDNIIVFESFMKQACLLQNQAYFRRFRIDLVKSIKRATTEKKIFIQRIKDITDNGKIHLNDLEEPTKSELLSLRENIKDRRKMVTYFSKMINKIKKLKCKNDREITKLASYYHNLDIRSALQKIDDGYEIPVPLKDKTNNEEDKNEK